MAEEDRRDRGAPLLQDAIDLLDWRPEFGVITVCLATDPGAQEEARTRLRNGLVDLERSGPVGRKAHASFQASARRVAARFESGRQRARGEIGIVEVAEEPAREVWWTSQASPSSTAIAFGERSLVAPLVELAQCGRPRGVVLLSGDRVRLLEWRPGQICLQDEWELTLLSDEWRDKKSLRTVDPTRSQAVTSSGRDLFDERMERSRKEFLASRGREIASRHSTAGWTDVIAYGSDTHFQSFRRAFGTATSELTLAETTDLISMPSPDLESIVSSAVEAIEAKRHLDLVDTVLNLAESGDRGALGKPATERTLSRGQVDHLLVGTSCSPAKSDPMIREALLSGSEISLISGEACAVLDRHDGVGARLRYGSAA